MKKVFVILLICFPLQSWSQPIGLDLLGDLKKIEVPFKFKQDYILVDIFLEGKIPLTFIYDTGAGHTILFDKILTDLLKVEYDNSIKILGSDLTDDVSALICRNLSLQLKNQPAVKRDILVLEENYLKMNELTGLNIQGILGASFFSNLVVNINYERRILTFYHPEHFDPPSKGFAKIPIEVKNSKPYISTFIQSGTSDPKQVLILVDTGASLTFLLHANLLPDINLPDKLILGNLGIGLGGFLTGYIGKTKELRFGPFVFPDLLTSYQDVDSLVISERISYRDGIMGNSLLSRFEFTIDYHNELIYLKPAKDYNKEFEYDKSGLFVLAFGEKLNKYMVSAVIHDSPADMAGIEPGDVILKVGCWNTRFLSLGNITNKLSGKAGKKIRMKIKRGEEKMKLSFRLKDMI